MLVIIDEVFSLYAPNAPGKAATPSGRRASLPAESQTLGPKAAPPSGVALFGPGAALPGPGAQLSAPKAALLGGVALSSRATLSPHPTGHPLTARHPVAVINGLSKLCAAPEVKLGWIALTGGTAAARRAMIDRLDTLHDTYLTVSAYATAAAEVFTRHPGAITARATARATIATARQRAIHRLGTIEGWTPYPSTSGIHIPIQIDPVYAAFHFGTLNDEEIALAIVRQTGVYTHPGSFYRLSHPHFSGTPWLVVTCLITPQDLDRAHQRLTRL